MAAAAIYGWVMGNPKQLLIGWDSDSNGCGYSPKTVDYPFLYWPEMPDANTINQVKAGNYSDAIQILNFGVCVKSCPNASEPVNCSPT